MKRVRCTVFLFLLIILLLALAGALPSQASSQERGTNISSLLREAENLYRAHRYNEALPRYEQFLQTSPPERQGQHAWLRTAEIYGIKGDWNQARMRYERLLAVKTDSGISLRARYGVGQANYKLGNFLEAERILENLSASSLPGNLRFKTNALLTELSLRSGNTTQAFSRLLLMGKDLPFGEEEWFQDLNVRLLSRASTLDLEKLADLYRDTPLTAGVLLQLAKVELQANRPEKAKTWLTALQQRYPESPEAAQAKQLTPPVEKPEAPGPATTVGCLLPLSGENADVGRQVKNGLELAASQSGVALIIKDCANSSQRTAAAAAELAGNPQVLVLLGFFSSTTADAAAEAAEELEIPLLALTQRKDITLGRIFVFRDFLTQRLMLQALLNYTANYLGWQRYAILYPNSKYGHSLARQFTEETHRQAATVLGQASYAENGGDVAQAVQTLTQINPGVDGLPSLNAVFIPDDANIVAAIAKELVSTPLAHVRLLGTNILQTPATLKYAEVLSGILFPDGFFAADADPAVTAFVADYRQRFQQPPNYLAAQGYSSMRLLAETQKYSVGLTRQEFARKLRDQATLPGFSLFNGFNSEREAELTTKILTIQGREFQLEH